MPDPEKTLDNLNRAVDATRKPFAVVRDVAVGFASLVTMAVTGTWAIMTRKKADKESSDG